MNGRSISRNPKGVHNGIGLPDFLSACFGISIFFAFQVYLSEVLIAVTLILGLFSRSGALVVGTLMAINLWLGLYRSPAEWPWTYFFLVIIQLTLLVPRRGRNLGLDALLLGAKQAFSGRGLWVRLARILS